MMREVIEDEYLREVYRNKLRMALLALSLDDVVATISETYDVAELPEFLYLLEMARDAILNERAYDGYEE